MRNIFCVIIGFILFSLFIPTTYSQNPTENQESSLKYRRKNLGVEKKKSFSKVRRGGVMTYPRGIADKDINFGFTVGGDIALMSALNVEKCPYGGNFSLFMHGILENTNTVALGAEIKGFYLLGNQEKLISEFRVPGSEVEPIVKVGNWILGAVQFSVVGNFNPMPRFNLQLKVNAGPLVAVVPPYEINYQFKERQTDGTYRTTIYDYKYEAPISQSMSIGGALTVGMDVLYALSKNTEFKAGVDWSYLRFNYSRIGIKKIVQDAVEIPEEIPILTKEVAQFGVFDIHLGFAFSF
ncbi:MAG: hypothetical protein PHC83_02155 [Bacteroidales bacterium]|jgi:hypothetical protein|nr:hypothetical protein [Bacteroidales bacterium]MDD4209410.1 hypothetical protein [Bacteroidales bacterium]MDY0014946.1 hypothetical protein [Bacteroidales bacterium]